MRRLLLIVSFVVAPSLHAELREFNIFFSHGRSFTSPHGRARFRSLQFEFLGRSRFVAHYIPKAEVGVSLTYSDIRQPRSWFGYTYGDPDDSVRGENAFLFIRRSWRETSSTQPYIELGTGPMWSNRRVPAATARLNFDSQLGFGARLFADAHPVFIEYRFSHISNLAFGDNNPGHPKRNPGWNVNTILIGTRIHKFAH